MVREDDVLLWRMVFLYMVAEYTRRAQLKPEPVHFALEQPASPRPYQPEVVSFWDTSEWQGIQKEFNLREVTFNQGSLGGLAMKPTTLGTTFDLCMDDFSMPSQQPERNVSSSKQLERWAPGLMNAVSSSLIKDVFKQPVKLKTLSWEEHVKFGHVPYRKDCPTCQQSSQHIAPHRKDRCPQAGVLALDTCGPLLPASDLGSWKCRYFLAGSYTFMVPKGTQNMLSLPEEPDEELKETPALEQRADEPGGDERDAAEDLQPAARFPPAGEAAVEIFPPDQPLLNDPGGDERDAAEGVAACRMVPTCR